MDTSTARQCDRRGRQAGGGNLVGGFLDRHAAVEVCKVRTSKRGALCTALPFTSPDVRAEKSAVLPLAVVEIPYPFKR